MQSGSGEGAVSQVTLLVAIAAGVAIVQTGVGLLANYATEAQAATVNDYVHNVMHKKSIELDLTYYENPHYFDTLHRAQKEGPYRPTTIVNGLTLLGQNTVSLIVMVGLLFTFHWSVGLLLFVYYPRPFGANPFRPEEFQVAEGGHSLREKSILLQLGADQ